MMEIKDLILLIWRNVMYIVLGLVAGVSIGFFASKVQPPVYEATTKIFVGRSSQQSTSDMLSLSDEQLLAINLQLAKSPVVLNDVSSQLGSKVDADNIQAGAIPNTLIIQIKVQDGDPQRAVTIADLIIQALVQQNEKLLSGRYAGLETALSEQIDQVEKQIDSLQTQIGRINNTSIQEQLKQVNQQIEQLKADVSNLEQEIASFPDYLTPLDRISLAEKQAQLDQLHSLMTFYQQIQTNLTYIGKPVQSGPGLENPRLTTLQSALSLYRQINTNLINSRENARLARTQSGKNIIQIVSATLPKEPVRPMPVLYVLLGGVVGLVLAATSILVADHMDDSMRSGGQIEELLGVPFLGFVFENNGDRNELAAAHDPFSKESEAFRALGTSLEIVNAGKMFHTVMVVNAEPAGAKTTIAANLAVVNAQQGKNVILLDGDLKHPHLHNLFRMKNQIGFAELINDSADIKGACYAVNDIQGLFLISGGIAAKELTAWLDVKKWEQLLSKLHKLADLVIVDSPPADVADAQILASKMNTVLLVIEAGHTRVDSARATLKRFKLIEKCRVSGVVLNRITQYRKINKPFLTWLKMKLQKNEKHGRVDGEIEKPAISAS